MMKQRANMIQWITTRVGIWSLDSFKFASKSLPMAWTHQCPSLIAAPSFLICVKEVNSSSSVISEAEFQFCTPQFSSFTQSCPTLCDPKDCSTRGFPVHHQLLELAQTHVHRVSDAIPPSHHLSSPSPPAFNLSHHQGLFHLDSSSHQVAKVLELQRQSFPWIFRVDFL